jgi:hypothetical protein
MAAQGRQANARPAPIIVGIGIKARRWIVEKELADEHVEFAPCLDPMRQEANARCPASERHSIRGRKADQQSNLAELREHQNEVSSIGQGKSTHAVPATNQSLERLLSADNKGATHEEGCCQLTTCVLRPFGSTSPTHVRPVEPSPV